VHTLTLGVGAPVVEVKADSWRTAVAKNKRAEVRAEGGIPLLTKDIRRAKSCALAVLQTPKVGRMIRDAECELSAWWRDPITGVMLRLRIDALYLTPDGDVIALDLKTAETADPVAFAASIRGHGYHQQQDWYEGGLTILGRKPRAFLFPVVARRPPHLVSLNRVPPRFLARAGARNRAAVDKFAACLTAGEWPDYGTDIHEIEQPAWAYRED
ncbi:PD-(D/E)XK nuclease-like domain-containing protein, partial [Paenibacillus sp. NPDC056722]|uniref:PD-(D/E)XK nuclease-like domain-containing protein n=1 Tax=Paenibacillus sp. NPDC056722 TaxID=3345924 RepID=UPI00369137B4